MSFEAHPENFSRPKAIALATAQALFIAACNQAPVSTPTPERVNTIPPKVATISPTATRKPEVVFTPTSIPTAIPQPAEIDAVTGLVIRCFYELRDESDILNLPNLSDLGANPPGRKYDSLEEGYIGKGIQDIEPGFLLKRDFGVYTTFLTRARAVFSAGIKITGPNEVTYRGVISTSRDGNNEIKCSHTVDPRNRLQLILSWGPATLNNVKLVEISGK